MDSQTRLATWAALTVTTSSVTSNDGGNEGEGATRGDDATSLLVVFTQMRTELGGTAVRLSLYMNVIYNGVLQVA